MDCGRAPTASAAAAPARAPAQRAGSVVKWAASHSSMQPESCRFNRGLANRCPANSIRPHLEVIAEYGKTVESIYTLAKHLLVNHASHDHGGVGTPETEGI